MKCKKCLCEAWNHLTQLCYRHEMERRGYVFNEETKRFVKKEKP
jgi:hypothetical protein